MISEALPLINSTNDGLGTEVKEHHVSDECTDPWPCGGALDSGVMIATEGQRIRRDSWKFCSGRMRQSSCLVEPKCHTLLYPLCPALDRYHTAHRAEQFCDLRFEANKL